MTPFLRAACRVLRLSRLNRYTVTANRAPRMLSYFDVLGPLDDPFILYQDYYPLSCRMVKPNMFVYMQCSSTRVKGRLSCAALVGLNRYRQPSSENALVFCLTWQYFLLFCHFADPCAFIECHWPVLTGPSFLVRQADQEIWPGEGVFFGLSTVIKFPGNYSESPFSVIGSGVTCLPQRVSICKRTRKT